MRAQIRIAFSFPPRRWVVERLLAGSTINLSESGYVARKGDLLLERLSSDHDRRSTRLINVDLSASVVSENDSPVQKAL